MIEMKKPWAPILANFTRAQLADRLGISRNRLRRWIERHGLKVRKLSGSFYPFIPVADFRDWAENLGDKLWLLAGIERDRLEWLDIPPEILDRIPKYSRRTYRAKKARLAP